MFSCCAFGSNSQDLRNFRDNRGSESSSLVGNKHYSGVTGNKNADFTRCAARKAMEMHECMGQKCLFVSHPKLLPIDFRGSTSYVLSFFAGAMALIVHAYSLKSVNRASNSIAFAKKLNI